MVEIAEYTVKKKLTNIEIRNYPACIIATTTMTQVNKNSGFSRVAGYIFGANTNNKKIAMTAPVVMSNTQSEFTMTFIMPKKYKLSELPTPHNSEVILKKQPKRTLAVLQFSGFINQDHIAQKTTELLKNTKMEKIKTKGKPFFMAYDAPWTIPFLRRNEVAIEVAD